MVALAHGSTEDVFGENRLCRRSRATWQRSLRLLVSRVRNLRRKLLDGRRTAGPSFHDAVRIL